MDPIPSVCVPSSSCPLNSQEQVNVDFQVTGSDKEVAFSSSSHVSKKKVPAVSSPAGPSNTRPVRSRDFSGQFPDPCYVAFPPLSRLSVWQNDLEKLGFSPQAINLAIKSQKPGTSRQYQSGWGLLVKYIVEHGIRHEDITASLLGNLVVSQFVEKNRATTTCLNYLYAWRKPVKILFGFDILSNENVMAIISGMKQDRPIKRGMVVFPKWRLQWLLDHLNSEIFEPLDQQSSRIICVKFMILTLLDTGRRLGEISALTKDVTYHPDGSISFKWFPAFKAKWERDPSIWKSELPKISPITSGDIRLCPVRAFRLYKNSNPLKPDPARLFPFRKNQISCLVRSTIIDSIRIALPSCSEQDLIDFNVKVHHLRKFAASYSRKYLRFPYKDLAKWVGSKAHVTLNSCYVRDVPRVNATFKVPLGIIYPNTRVCHKLRKD